MTEQTEPERVLTEAEKIKLAEAIAKPKQALNHELYRGYYREGLGFSDTRKAMVFPEITANDRNEVLLALELSGYEQGHHDGMFMGAKHGADFADPIPIRHILAHQKKCLEVLAQEVAITELSSASLRSAWLAGYKAGVIQGHQNQVSDWKRSPSVRSSPAPDPSEREGN